MCDPIALIGTALSVGGSIAGGVAGRSAAKQQKQEALANIRRLELGASVAKGDAAVVDANASLQIGRVQQSVDAAIGGQTAFFAGGGIDQTYGSPLQLIGQSAAQGEADQQLIGAEALRQRAGVYSRVAGLQQEAADQAGQALALDQRGRNAFISGLFGAGTALIKGVQQQFPGLGTSAAGAGNSSGIGSLGVQAAKFGFGVNV